VVDKRRQNEDLFQEANEILERRFQVAGIDGAARFICECASTTCMQDVRVDLETFASVRNQGWYMILDGHQDDAIERVVERREAFIIVEKTGDS